MTIDEAIAVVRSKADDRTRWVGQEPFVDEVLVGEIERLRQKLLNVQMVERVKAAVRGIAG